MSARVHVLERRIRDIEAAVRHHRLPSGPDARDLAQHHAATIRVALDHPVALRRLQAATRAVADTETLDLLVPAVLEQAMSLLGTDLGDVQVLDPAADGLRLVAHSGFDDRFAEMFALVSDDATAYGRAFRHDCQVFIPDVELDEMFAPHRTVAASYGFRSVQSTPLRDYTGRIVGVVSTYWRAPRRADQVDLELLEVFADYSGQRIAMALPEGAPQGLHGEERTAWRITTAMLDTLLGPPSVPAREGEEAPGGDTSRLPPSRPGPFERALAADGRIGSLADLVVRDVFAAGLELDAVRSMSADSSVRARVLRISDMLDELIARVRSAALARDDRHDG